MTVANSMRKDFKFAHQQHLKSWKNANTHSKRNIACTRKLINFIFSQVAIFQPPYIVTKLDPSPFVYDGPATTDELRGFIETKQ